MFAACGYIVTCYLLHGWLEYLILASHLRLKFLNIIFNIVYCVFFQMIEMECFKEINVFEMDGVLCSDLDVNRPNPAPKRGFFYRLFHREASASAPAAVVKGGGA